MYCFFPIHLPFWPKTQSRLVVLRRNLSVTFLNVLFLCAIPFGLPAATSKNHTGRVKQQRLLFGQQRLSSCPIWLGWRCFQQGVLVCLLIPDRWQEYPINFCSCICVGKTKEAAPQQYPRVRARWLGCKGITSLIKETFAHGTRKKHVSHSACRTIAPLSLTRSTFLCCTGWFIMIIRYCFPPSFHKSCCFSSFHVPLVFHVLGEVLRDLFCVIFLYTSSRFPENGSESSAAVSLALLVAPGQRPSICLIDSIPTVPLCNDLSTDLGNVIFLRSNKFLALRGFTPGEHCFFS